MLVSAIGEAISTSSAHYACDGKQPRCSPLPALWTSDKRAVPLQRDGYRTALLMFTTKRHTFPFSLLGIKLLRTHLGSTPCWAFGVIFTPSMIEVFLTEVYLDGSINQGGGSPLETTGEGSAQTRQYSAISATELKGRTFNWEVSSSFSKR